MTAREVKRIRRRLGLSQAALAKRMGVHWMTPSRWERGTVKITKPVEIALRALLDAELRSGRKKK